MKPSERIQELVRNMQYFYPESETAALYMARQNKNILDQIITYLDEQYEKEQKEIEQRHADLIKSVQV